MFFFFLALQFQDRRAVLRIAKQPDSILHSWRVCETVHSRFNIINNNHYSTVIPVSEVTVWVIARKQQLINKSSAEAALSKREKEERESCTLHGDTNPLSVRGKKMR